MATRALKDALVAAGLGEGSDLFAELPAEARAALEVLLSYEEAPVLPAADDGAAAEEAKAAEAKAAKAAKKEAKKAEKEAKKAAAAAAEADAKATAKEEKKAAKAAKKAAKKAAEEEEAAAAAAPAAEAKPVKKKKKKKKKAEEEDGAAAAAADVAATPVKTKRGKKKKKKITEDVTDSVKKTAKKGKKSFLRVIGAGTGGISEMQSKLANDQTYYGLLRFDVGSGSFVRTKRIFVHFTGDDCAAKKRNKASQAKGKVKGLLGQTHADMVLTDAAECEIEQIGDRFSTLFASDHGEFILFTVTFCANTADNIPLILYKKN